MKLACPAAGSLVCPSPYKLGKMISIDGENVLQSCTFVG